MKIEFNVNYDELKALNKKLFIRALNRTLNDEGRKLFTATRKEVRDTYAIKDKDIKKSTKVKSSTFNDLKYQFTIESSRKNLGLFSPVKKATKGHISVKIRKDRKRQTLKREFIIKNGRVITRVGKTQKLRGVSTISIPQMFNKKIMQRAKRRTERSLPKTLEYYFDYYLEKVK